MWQAVKLKYAADSHTTPLHPTTLIKADPSADFRRIQNKDGLTAFDYAWKNEIKALLRA